MQRKFLFSFGLLVVVLGLQVEAQRFPEMNYWQQRVEYAMDIDFDVEKHQFTGDQALTYHNFSPDTLKRVFYHLYFNAFQPGSMMDVRSRNIDDPDPRVGSRIRDLSPEEIGYNKVLSLTQDGMKVSHKTVGTVLEAALAKPIPPGGTCLFTMKFEGQVPVQIRRSGRNNREGIDYSMTQWYPKMAEYDQQGWHAHPYIGREFHGVWGDFKVNITIDSSFTLASTGYLLNPKEIGHGYLKKGKAKKSKTGKLTWKFEAPDVHDFMWAADPDYTHVIHQSGDGPELHFFYQKGSRTEAWADLPEQTAKAFAFMNKYFGKYPYKKYSVIQGGDGGMEYPMGTLVTGHRSIRSLVGVTIHELIHSWYQMVLATNESLYPWMDEGFTSYATTLTEDHVWDAEESVNPFSGSYNNYIGLVLDGKEEALSTHADHYTRNRSYGTASYSKGQVFLAQMGYVIGKENLARGILEYFDTWKFKHPRDLDFVRVMEKVSDLELDWYREYFVNTTKTIDYGIDQAVLIDGTYQLRLKRIGEMPMPLDIEVKFEDGSSQWYYIPLEIMRGEKPAEKGQDGRKVLRDWPWTHPEYVLRLPKGSSPIKSIEIDPSTLMADINRENNRLVPANLSKAFGN